MHSRLELTAPSKLPALPFDVIQCVVEQSNGDSSTLASLCLLDTRCFHFVLRLLYGAVRLCTLRAIENFCNTVARLNRRLGMYTFSLHIDPPDPTSAGLNHLVISIRSALRYTPNLVSLALHIDTPATVPFYDQLHSDPPTFSLRSYSCYPATSTHFFAFISAQPTVTHLTLHESRLFSSEVIRRVSSEYLPNLVSIRANPLTVHALVPGRPVSHVDSGRTVLYSATTHLLCEAFRESTAPGGVEDVSVSIPKTRFWTSASGFITRLAAVCESSLRSLRLRMPDLRVGALDVGSYTVLIEVLAASLGGFTRLQHFLFDGAETNVPAVVILEDLGRVGALDFWTSQCPTLRSVVLFGVDLP